jgi:hypothetical protein
MTKSIQIFSPVGDPNNPVGRLAARPDSLERRRIGLLDNGKEFSDVVLESLAESLRVRFPNAQQKIWRKGYPAKLAPFLKEMAAESDVAISGVGH